MQISGNSLLLQDAGLIRPAPGNQGEGRAVLPDHLQLLLPKLWRNESKDADAPGQRTQPALDLRQQRLHFLRPHQGQSQERQGAPFSHPCREFRHVADPRHRSLQDGVTGAVGTG